MVEEVVFFQSFAISFPHVVYVLVYNKICRQLCYSANVKNMKAETSFLNGKWTWNVLMTNTIEL